MAEEKTVPDSPVYPAGTEWDATPSTRYYESEVTAMVRSMLKDPQIQEDQRFAWQRWRSGNNPPTKE
ncbi:MAG TPA: hypothetical protein VMK05_17405 [Burkholderiales bacterium]|nr:hypothetical protein [Burkholderiales bacterium]